jgi:predicted ATPase
LGKLFGDRGYISKELFSKLYEQQLQLITRYKKNMKQKLVKLIDKIFLHKRSLIETVNDQLKHIFQIEYSRHRSPYNTKSDFQNLLIILSRLTTNSICFKKNKEGMRTGFGITS